MRWNSRMTTDRIPAVFERRDARFDGIRGDSELRILFDEESRARLLRENGHELAKYEQALESHLELVRAALLSAHERNLNEFQQVRQAVDRLHDASVARAASRQRRIPIRRWARSST